jgi:hypothetical protein
MDDNMHTTVRVAIGENAITYEAVETTAPADYDGFGTFCVMSYDGKDDNGKERTYRTVLIDKRHFTWQTMRYQSGVHTTRISTLPESAFADYLWNRIWGKVPQ